MTEFLKKVILPVGLIGLLLLLFKPIYMPEGEINILYLWILIGIPFGMKQMCVWLVPQNYDIGGTIGIVAVNFIIGGLIGGVVAIVRLLQAAWHCLKCIGSLFAKKSNPSY